ncbi:MAG: hypothetical protein ABIB47_04405 [Candidatus Woesearchaeota archaeon]
MLVTTYNMGRTYSAFCRNLEFRDWYEILGDSITFYETFEINGETRRARIEKTLRPLDRGLKGNLD